MKRVIPIAILMAFSARADILPGLEAYGDLTLVDEVDCATDTTHEFHEYAGVGSYSCGSYVTNILGSACRVLPHAEKDDLYFSYRLGRGKGLVAHDMYLLIVEYPEDVPRTATLINRAMNSRNGWHTGISVGETVVAHIIGQTHPESMNIPLSGTWKRLEQVMFLNEKVFPHDSTDSDSYMDSESNGFDVIIHAFTAADAPDSAGPAVRAIRLYRMNDEKGLATPVRYPAGDTPKRHITWRDEMGKHSAYNCNADRYDNFRMKMRLMKELGLDTWSRDILEFGYNQYFDVSYANNGNANWMYANSDYWTTEVGIYADAGIYLLPFYEYAGSRGPGGLGVNSARKAVQMFRGGYGGHFNLFVANANGASGANVDITDDAAYTDFAAILDCTILRYKNQANFLGAWIRNRGSMPVSFSQNTRNRFCADTGRASGSVSVDDLSNVSEYGDEAYRYICQMMKKPALYQEYRTWWNGKRAQWLKAMQQHLADGGLPSAKIFFSGVWGEAGWELQNLAYYRDYFNRVAAEDATAWKNLSGSSAATCGIGEMSWNYTHYGIDNDAFTWFPDEYNHAAPRNDPETYTNVSDVALCYPYHGVHTTIPASAANYRNASGDLFFSRHFCLYEGCGQRQKRDSTGTVVKDSNDKVVYEANNGYFTTEMDRCGRAIMLPELYALAYQDPTVIGFMQGGHLARNSTKEFRDFNEHFLSLPAVKGTVLWGGGWGVKPYTIRKYVTSDATYYAIVNTSSQSFDNSYKYLSDESGTFTLYDTVTGEPLTCGSGYARFALEPFQLKVYSTVPPDTPKFLVAVPAVGSTTASIPLAVTTLGGNSATLRTYVSPNPDMSNATAIPVRTLSAAGTSTVELNGLSPNTTYYATFGITNTLSKGAAHVLSFTTDIPSENPRGTMTMSADVNDATFSVNLSSLGDGSESCDLYAVFTPATPGIVARSGKVGTRNSTGACSFTFAPLSSEVTYTAELFATNNLGYGTRIGVDSVTTLAKPTVAVDEGVYVPGLVQAKVSTGAKTSMNKTFDILSAADATRVPGAAMAGVTANADTCASQCYENPYDGQKFYYSKYDTTFGYAGEMYFEAGRTYTIGKSFDDGVLVKIDGTSILDHQQYNSTTTKTYSPSSTGWKPIEIRLWDGDGGKGPKNGWSSFTGVAYNTNGFTTISAETTGNWTPFMANAGAPLRCRSGIKSLASVGHIAGNGSMLIVPVMVDSYDEDNALAVYVTQDAAAAAKFSDPDGTSPDLSAWTRANGPAPAIGLGQTVIVQVDGLALSPGSTVYAIARLTNARTGYDVISAAATYTLPADTTMPEFLASLSDAGFLDAAFSINVLSMGTGASAITVSLEISGGGTSVTYTAASNVAGYSGVYRTPAELEYATDYTATVAAINDLGKGATNTLHFSTLPCPIALSEASGLCNGAGTLSSASITVDDSTASSSLTLYANDVAVSNWTAVAAGATYTGTVAITVGATNVFRFVLMADGCREIVRTVEVEGRRIVEWFTVPFTNDAYAAWAPVTGEDPYAPEGARWTFYGAPGENTISTDGGERHLAISTGTDGLASYAPLSPSDEDRALEIFGRAKFSTVDECTPAAPDVPPIAAITVGTENGKGIFFGWADDKWNAFTDSSVNTNGWTLWSAKLDFANGTVEYSVDGTKLSSEGVTALPLAAAAARQASRVEFQGIGAVGSFQALYRDQDESGGGTVVLVPAAIRVDGTGVSFGNVGGSTSFVIGLTNARSDHWYVAFAADSLTTPSADWTCVACAAPENGATSVDLQCDTVDGDGHAIPTRFFRIFESTASIDLGTRYGDLGGAGEGKQE